MTDKRKPWTPIEIRFHHAIPGWCKLVGLRIREIPDCEGGGYMIPEADARLYAGAPAMADLLERMGKTLAMVHQSKGGIGWLEARPLGDEACVLLAKIKGE